MATQTTTPAECPHCNLSDLMRYGTRKGKQIYLCKSCGKRFTEGGALPGRRISATVVGDAIAAYYDGLSYRDIQRRIESLHGFKPSTATLYEWMRHYVRLGTDFMQNFKAGTGDTWVADETVVRVDGKDVWLWNVMDERTRYLLATHLSYSRTIYDAVALFKKAKRNALKSPDYIKTDGLAAYISGIEKVFGAETKHVQTEGIRSEMNNNLAERLQGTIKERTKVMRGMERLGTADIVIEGFRLHYNHMKPHHALKGRTPAEAAGLATTFKDWIEVAHLRDDTREVVKKVRMKERRLRQSTLNHHGTQR